MPAYNGAGAGSRGFGGSEYAPPSGPPPGGDYRGEGAVGEKDNTKRNLALGVVGGVAAGVIGAVVVDEALGMFNLRSEKILSSIVIKYTNAQYKEHLEEDDHHGPPPGEGYAAPPPPMEAVVPAGPALDAYGNPISEDDRESIASAREEYQEALNDSDASSSDIEEAREEYQEEVEEAYYDE